MNPPIPKDSNIIPLHAGKPLIVRLINGQDVMGIVYVLSKQAIPEEPEDDDDNVHTFTQIMIESPIVLTAREPHYMPWVPMSDNSLFPLNNDHIVLIAPLGDEMTANYLKWAAILYKPLADESGPTDLSPDTPVSQNVVDQLMTHVFNVKGKPN